MPPDELLPPVAAPGTAGGNSDGVPRGASSGPALESTGVAAASFVWMRLSGPLPCKKAGACVGRVKSPVVSGSPAAGGKAGASSGARPAVTSVVTGRTAAGSASGPGTVWGTALTTGSRTGSRGARTGTATPTVPLTTPSAAPTAGSTTAATVRAGTRSLTNGTECTALSVRPETSSATGRRDGAGMSEATVDAGGPARPPSSRACAGSAASVAWNVLSAAVEPTGAGREPREGEESADAPAADKAIHAAVAATTSRRGRRNAQALRSGFTRYTSPQTLWQTTPHHKQRSGGNPKDRAAK